jgi:hypothetical protein
MMMMTDAPHHTSNPHSDFQFMTEQQLACLPPIEYLIESVLPARSLSILYGPWDVGKTFLAIDWACSIDHGAEWAGRACRRATVLYIAAEGAEGMAVRLKAWGHEHGLPPSRILTMPDALQLVDGRQTDRHPRGLPGARVCADLLAGSAEDLGD